MVLMKNIHIAVNTRMLLKNRLDGIGWFAFQTLRRITAAHPEVKFTFIFDRPFDSEFVFGKNVTPLLVRPPVRHAILYYLWYHVSVRRLLNKIKPDLFLSPDGLLSLGADCKQLAVMHDINFKHHPKDLKFWTSKFFNYYFPKYVKAASRIVAVSEYTKNDLIKEYNADPAKIDVILNGINEGYRKINDVEKSAIKNKFTKGKDYFLFVGSVHPRKNIVRLIEAFDKFKAESASDIKLVIAGSFFWGKHEISRALNKTKFKTDVIFTGRCADDDLRLLTGGALSLTYVPYFEGFGMPLVEAMQSEIPIIASNVTSIPEIAGKAAIYVDPFNTDEIKNAMLKIFSDGNLRNTLIEAGRLQRQKFSWDKSAEQLWEVIEKCLV